MKTLIAATASSTTKMCGPADGEQEDPRHGRPVVDIAASMMFAWPRDALDVDSS